MEKSEVISNLQKLAEELKDKKYVTSEDVRSIPKLDYYVGVHFRTLGRALKAAGLPSSKLASSMSVSNEDLLKYLKDLEKDLGHTPVVWDIDHDKNLYKKYSDTKFSWSLYKTRFGGLLKAKELAGVGKSGLQVTKLSQPKGDSEADESDYTEQKNRFWGQAAELHVTAELLYRGFQAANIPVDVGLDVLAVKDNKTFYFQVKHKDLKNNKAINLTKSSFDKRGGGDVYFIFVLLSDDKREFLIIPFHIVNDWIREGLADDTDKGYLVYIKKENGNYKLKDKILNSYLDRWEDIK